MKRTLAMWTLVCMAGPFVIGQAVGPGVGAVLDFDGDGKTDLGIWRPSTGAWWLLKEL